MNEEKNQKLFAVILVLLCIALGVYKLFFENKNKKDNIDTETISIVRDNNRFFTVSNCANSYVEYITAGDTDDILILLSDNYKKENSINSSNLYDYIEKPDGFYAFSARKMYEQRLSKSMYKYYVYGVLQEEDIHSLSDEIDYYLIVILDESNTTFAIEPYDGEIFNN